MKGDIVKNVTSAQRRIRDAWKDRLDGVESVDVPKVSEEIANELRGDPEFCALFIEQMLPTSVNYVGRKILMGSKRDLREGVVAIGSTVGTVEAIRAEVQAEIDADHGSKWMAWLEFDPGKQVNVALPKMSKRQLLLAYDAKMGQGTTYLRDALWFKELAGRMTDVQLVEDVWSDDEIGTLRDRIEMRITSAVKATSPRTKAA
jgi:hypothetical protein